jgi:hypothetical protein
MLMVVNISVTGINAKLAQNVPTYVKNTNSVAVLTRVWAGVPRNLGSITGRSNNDSVFPKTSRLPGANSDIVSPEIRWPEL